MRTGRVGNAPATTTQAERPWHAASRTAFQALIGLAVVVPLAVAELGVDPASIPWLAGVLAVCAGVARVMAVPAVESWLRRFLPFLAANPPPRGRRRP